MRPGFAGLLCYLRRVAPGTEEDGVLLARFGQGDGDAFTALVVRHAPVVWGVCRRLLGRSPDAAEPFQATFVVLALKGTALDGGRPLGPWLHKVARETALKARQQAARRRSHGASTEEEPAVED